MGEQDGRQMELLEEQNALLAKQLKIARLTAGALFLALAFLTALAVLFLPRFSEILEQADVIAKNLAAASEELEAVARPFAELFGK